MSEPIITQLTKKERLAHFFKLYGPIAIGTHFAISAISYFTIYYALKKGVDIKSYFEKWGIKLKSETA
jgi:hypothetical protein